MQNYYVVFHDDVDGIVSAAIYLHNVVRGSRYKLLPVSSSHRGPHFQNLLKSIKEKDQNAYIAVLDFEKSDYADIFFDHHFDAVLGSEEVHTSKIHYDPSAKSAARIVCDHTEGVIKFPTAFIDMVDIIDSGKYKSLDKVFNDTHPLMLLRAFFEMSNDKSAMKRSVELLSKCHLNSHEAIHRLDIDESILADIKKVLQVVSKFTTISGNMSIIYQKRPGQFPRYAEYYLYPNVKYCLRFSKIDKDKYQVQVGYNMWHKEKNEINIGKSLSTIPYLVRGGGHFGVGGAIVLESDCDKLTEDLFKLFGNEDKMEKYAVDKDDKIEKKADDLVKTGEAKSKEDAREMAIKEGENETKTN